MPCCTLSLPKLYCKYFDHSFAELWTSITSLYYPDVKKQRLRLLNPFHLFLRRAYELIQSYYVRRSYLGLSARTISNVFITCRKIMYIPNTIKLWRVFGYIVIKDLSMLQVCKLIELLMTMWCTRNLFFSIKPVLTQFMFRDCRWCARDPLWTKWKYEFRRLECRTSRLKGWRQWRSGALLWWVSSFAFPANDHCGARCNCCCRLTTFLACDDVMRSLRNGNNIVERSKWKKQVDRFLTKVVTEMRRCSFRRWTKAESSAVQLESTYSALCGVENLFFWARKACFSQTTTVVRVV